MKIKKKICGALYFNYFDSVKGNKQSLFEFRPVYYFWSNPELKELRILSETFLEEIFPSKLMEVMASGLGCLLVHKSILEKLNSGQEMKKHLMTCFFQKTALMQVKKFFWIQELSACIKLIQ
ncbi:MAG: hypothetical protein ABIA76_01775 [Candidatus Diapherotrites archaeon]